MRARACTGPPSITRWSHPLPQAQLREGRWCSQVHSKQLAKSHPIPSGPCSRPTPGEVRSPGTTPEPGLWAWRALAVRSPLPWRRPGACSETAIVGLPGVASAQQWLDWGLAASLAVAVGSSAFPRSSLLAAGQTEARDMWGCQGAGTAQDTKTQDTKK